VHHRSRNIAAAHHSGGGLRDQIRTPKGGIEGAEPLHGMVIIPTRVPAGAASLFSRLPGSRPNDPLGNL